METFITVISAIFVFGFLIFIHEFGHFIFARIFGVTVNEFSIGMGPKLVWYDSKKSGTKYALSMIPIGGYVAMAGENEECDDPNSFDKKPAWQRLIITVAGATFNIVLGIIAVFILTAITRYGGTTVARFVPREESGLEVSSENTGLRLGDEIIKVGKKRVTIADELSYQIMRRGNEPVDITVIRDGKEQVLEDVVFPTAEENGIVFGVMDFQVYAAEKTFGSFMSYSLNKSWMLIRMVWESVFDLITGRYSVNAVSGPVGISTAIGDAAMAGPTQLIYLVALISINLGVMNLLPIPALDGGRLITILAEMITRKKIPQKVEAAINGVGLMILLGLSVLIMIKDVFQLIG